jgi:hypothetical protein
MLKLGCWFGGVKRWRRSIYAVSVAVSVTALAILWILVMRARTVAALENAGVRIRFDDQQGLSPRWFVTEPVSGWRRRLGWARIEELEFSPSVDLSVVRSIRRLCERSSMVVRFHNLNPERIPFLVAHRDSFSDVAELYIVLDPAKTISGENLRELSGLGDSVVVSVVITSTLKQHVADEAVKLLAKLSQLKRLILVSDGVSDAAFRQLASLRALEVLMMNHVTLSSNTLCQFKAVPLPCLFLEDVQFPDRAFECLGAMKTLERLMLIHCRIPVHGLRRLDQLPKLEHLILTGSLSEMSVLEGIRSMRHLRDLGLSNCPVSDRDIETLGSMTDLRSLSLAGTKMTPKGIAKLRKMLPSCRIDAADGI